LLLIVYLLDFLTLLHASKKPPPEGSRTSGSTPGDKKMKPSTAELLQTTVPSHNKRQLLRWAAASGAGAVLALSALSALAQAPSAFPNKPIKIVVPYSPGTGSDVLARTIGQNITEKTGHSVIIENREGAGSLIGTLAVAKAAPDGYTIMIAANTLVILPSQQLKPPYNPVTDFSPIVKVAAIPLVLAATPSLKINSVKELIAYAKANPGKLNYGTSGPGPSQNEMELFKQAVGIDVVEIPYKNTAQAMTDLIGGQLSLFPAVGPLVLQHIKSGRAIGLAVFDKQRSPQMSDLPAMTEEVSAPGYVATPVWYGFVAPAKTPPDIVAALAAMIQNAMASPEVNSRLVSLGAQPLPATTEQFTLEIKNEYEKSSNLAKKLGTAK
jgi:tripartite-type tricarboxylate transporter receptor subunit TctC